MNIINLLATTIMILMSITFFTMMERKLLSYIQIRKGPNKVSFLGILQPINDAIKLFNKNNKLNKHNNFTMSMSSPPISLLLSTLMIPILPINLFSEMDNKQNLLMFMILSSLAVYITLLIGWTSNSKYAILGSIRNIAQMISYEVNMFFMILLISLLSNSYSLIHMSMYQTMLWFMWGNFPIMIMWSISCMAELNRSPFDFTESESELVSGFNIEYMGSLFALIFLAEYMSILILSTMTTLMFMGSINYIHNTIPLIMFIMMTLLIRGTLPRFRYDILMKLSWKIILPMSLLILPMPMLLLILS